jgi:REP element-mobilizing transposase RayT
MLRGNSGQDIFKDDHDRVRFCLLLQYASERHQLNIHGFCLMRNHVHLVIQPSTSNLSDGMHALGFRYAQHFNKKYKQRGYLYQGRYKAVLVQSGMYLRRLVRYVHLNPVRAKIVQTPEDYQWSSHRAYIGEAEYAWLNCTLILDAFGGQSKGSMERLSLYIQMNDDEARNEVIEIRKSLRNGAYGDREFLEQWCPILNEGTSLADSHMVGIRKVTVQYVVETVCSRLNITKEDVRSEKRTKQLVQARMIMASLTQKLRAGSMTDLSKQISRDPTSLAKLAKKGASDVEIQEITDGLLSTVISEAHSSYA